MPNWCLNRLAISGPPEAVMDLVESVVGEESVFDFERLLPTPGELPDGGDYEAPSGIAAGLPRWFAWRREHWCVKWNAHCAKRRGYGRTGRVRYRFLTAYGPPAEFLDHLAQRWPEVAIDLKCEIEQSGTGTAVWNGALWVKANERG